MSHIYTYEQDLVRQVFVEIFGTHVGQDKQSLRNS